MLIHQTAEKLKEMRLGAMAELLLNQESQGAAAELSFEERLGLLVDYEWTNRQNKKLKRLLKNARLKIDACLEDTGYQHPRKPGKKLMTHLSSMQWLLAPKRALKRPHRRRQDLSCLCLRKPGLPSRVQRALF